MDFEQKLIGSAGFVALYGQSGEAVSRYCRIREGFLSHFSGEPGFFSASGRCEIIGNHTDHNGGRVLAGSISMDAVAAAVPTSQPCIRMVSEGFPGMFCVSLDDTAPKAEERGTTTALIRGVAARFAELGYRTGGFDAYVSSNVLRGSGLSSSAAIEVLICTVLSELYNQGGIAPEIMGRISQYAENRYFGKPCGLMDQLACACGSMIALDFSGEDAGIRRIGYDFASRGYGMIITDVRQDHADLTGEYAAITGDMGAVAAAMGKKRLIEVDEEDFYGRLPALRRVCSDRALLRAIHFFQENRRVDEAVAALEINDINGFFRCINRSGESSARLLQNLFAAGSSAQAIPLALELSRDLLRGRGAVRVHGGGFGGTILAFVPDDIKDEYIARMDSVFGCGAACELNIRAQSAMRVL